MLIHLPQSTSTEVMAWSKSIGALFLLLGVAYAMYDGKALFCTANKSRLGCVNMKTQSVLASCEKGFVNILQRVPQALGPITQLPYSPIIETLRKMFTKPFLPPADTECMFFGKGISFNH